MDMEPEEEIREIPCRPSSRLQDLMLESMLETMRKSMWELESMRMRTSMLEKESMRKLELESKQESLRKSLRESLKTMREDVRERVWKRLLYYGVNRLRGRLLYGDPDEMREKISTILAEVLKYLPMTNGKEEKNLTDVISQILDLVEIEKDVAVWLGESIDMDDAFETLKNFKSDIVHRVAKKLTRSDPIFLDRAQVNVANQLDRLTGRLLMFTEPKEVLIEEISSFVAEEAGNSFKEVLLNERNLSHLISRFVDLDEMEKHVAKRRWEKMEMDDVVRIESSDLEVNRAFERLKSFKSDIVHQVAKRLKLSELLDCSNDLMISYEDNRLNANPLRLRHYKKEIRRTLRLIEPTLKERDAERFPKNLAGYLKLKKIKDYFLKLIEQYWNEEERRMESSDERSKLESKGMVFKRNTLRKQHNSQRDDPGGLFPDLVELETVLEDCVFHFPQLASFIIIYGILDLEDLTVNDTNMDEKMLMISNQGCGEAHKLSVVVVGNTPIIVV